MGRQVGGFTLIELVSAIALLSLVIVAVSALTGWVTSEWSREDAFARRLAIGGAVTRLAVLIDDVAAVESASGTTVRFIDQEGRRRIIDLISIEHGSGGRSGSDGFLVTLEIIRTTPTGCRLVVNLTNPGSDDGIPIARLVRQIATLPVSEGTLRP